MMPGFKYVKDEDLDVDGTRPNLPYSTVISGTASKRKGQVVYGKLYQKI